MAKRIVLIGAGSAQFGYGTIGDILQSQLLQESTIVLHDINPVSLAKVKETAVKFVEEHKLPFTITSTTNRAEAFTGADFLIISIEVGDRFKLWEEDWRIPQQFGIKQVYGENGGPGGLFHAMRIIPPILEICAEAQKICPQATIFNYSNPMSRICTTVHRAFPDLKFIGLCHEIASLPKFLPLILGVPYEALDLKAAGLNHFSVVLSAIYKENGQDAYPDILAKAPNLFENMPKMEAVYKYAKETGAVPEAIEELMKLETEAWSEHRLFKVILEKFHLFPITSDSHFGEYIQWAYDSVDHKGILDFYRFYKDFLSTIEPHIELKLKERVVPIMEGIITNSGYFEEAVNVPNNGLIADLPDWIVVEVPAIVDKDGVHGISMGHLPKGFAGLMMNQVAVHDLTAEAILKKSKDLALQALLVDPNVSQYEGVEEMLDAMLDYQAKWLGYLQ
ncbi:MAG: alpha-glucosidase [Chloroflexi bacterium HGW-Chloroflexi-4]|jgi:alpha-galactosidase|nr:MAG: alpha-glucosidase [Chloroflexi bacterium HGW-Chloroflexi-4]